jgi:hypothetical protein
MSPVFSPLISPPPPLSAIRDVRPSTPGPGKASLIEVCLDTKFKRMYEKQLSKGAHNLFLRFY